MHFALSLWYLLIFIDFYYILMTFIINLNFAYLTIIIFIIKLISSISFYSIIHTIDLSIFYLTLISVYFFIYLFIHLFFYIIHHNISLNYSTIQSNPAVSHFNILLQYYIFQLNLKNYNFYAISSIGYKLRPKLDIYYLYIVFILKLKDESYTFY